MRLNKKKASKRSLITEWDDGKEVKQQAKAAAKQQRSLTDRSEKKNFFFVPTLPEYNITILRT